MNDINKVVIVGRLTRDPELKYTQSGKSITNFSIANNRSWKGSDGNKVDQVGFFDCVCWGALGEKVICEYARKGMLVIVEGRLEQQRWEDQNGNARSKVGVVTEGFQMLDGKREDQPADQVQKEFQGQDVPSNPFRGPDIPF